MIEPIDSSESKPTKKAGSMPNKARFDKELKVSKPDEAFFDEPKKRKMKTEEETATKSSIYKPKYYQEKKAAAFTEEATPKGVKKETDDLTANKALPPQVQDDGKSPIDTSFYEKEPSGANPPGWKDKGPLQGRSLSEQEKAPSGAAFGKEPTKEPGKTTPKASSQGSAEAQAKKQKQTKALEQEKATQQKEIYKETLSENIKKELIEKKKVKEKIIREKEKKESISSEKKGRTTATAKKRQTMLDISLAKKENYKPFLEKKKEKQYIKESTLAPLHHGMQIDASSQAQATATTQQVSSFLSTETSLLYDKMVGTIIQMSKDGIDQTQVILNSFSFSSSIFFDSKIIIERYATAPDSFNIRLVSPQQQAVALFNDNLDQLFSAFQNGNLKFKVGRLEAEHETDAPLFRRKKAIGDKSSDEQGK